MHRALVIPVIVVVACSAFGGVIEADIDFLAYARNGYSQTDSDTYNGPAAIPYSQRAYASVMAAVSYATLDIDTELVSVHGISMTRDAGENARNRIYGSVDFTIDEDMFYSIDGLLDYAGSYGSATQQVSLAGLGVFVIYYDWSCEVVDISPVDLIPGQPPTGSTWSEDGSLVGLLPAGEYRFFMRNELIGAAAGVAGGNGHTTLTLTPVPEPASLSLAVLGAMLATGRRR